MNTILVTGGAGFIGSSFVAQAVAAGSQVIVLDALTYAGHKENLEWITPSNAWTLIEGNICDGALVKHLFSHYQPDGVVHFAAESHVDNSITGSRIFIETNVIGTHTLLEAARAYCTQGKPGFRFVQVSTDEVYGTLGAEGYFSETSSYQPNSPYSASKASGDMLARAWFHTYGLPVITTHCSNNYGPRQHPEKLIPRMITQALRGLALPVYGKGENVRDWIHVEDHARGIMRALNQGIPGETYCFGGRAERRNIDVVHAVCDLLQEYKPQPQSYRDQIAYVEDRLGHDFRYAINDAKAERELGFTRAYSFEEGLRATVKWYLDNQIWCRKVSAA